MPMSFWITSRSPLRVAVVPRPGVVELEFAGPVDAGHEGRDQRAVLLAHAVDLAPSIVSVASCCWSRFSSLCRSMTSRWRLSPVLPLPGGEPVDGVPGDPILGRAGAWDSRSCRRFSILERPAVSVRAVPSRPAREGSEHPADVLH